MDTVLQIAAMFALSIPMAFGAAVFVRRGPELLAGFFGPSPPDGWPRGVQEEDPSFVATFRLGPATAVTAPLEEDTPRAARTHPVSFSVRPKEQSRPSG